EVSVCNSLFIAVPIDQRTNLFVKVSDGLIGKSENIFQMLQLGNLTVIKCSVLKAVIEVNGIEFFKIKLKLLFDISPVFFFYCSYMGRSNPINRFCREQVVDFNNSIFSGMLAQKFLKETLSDQRVVLKNIAHNLFVFSVFLIDRLIPVTYTAMMGAGSPSFGR